MKRLIIFLTVTILFSCSSKSPITVIDHNTLCTIDGAEPRIECDFTREKTDNSITIKTSRIGATILLPDSSITYFDSTGTILEGGRLFQKEDVTISTQNWAKFKKGYITIGDNMDEVVSNMRSITGKPGIIPKYAAGYWYLGDSKSLKELRENHISVDIVNSAENIEALHGHLASDITRGLVDFHTIEPSWESLEKEIRTAPGQSLCGNPYWAIKSDSKDSEFQERLHQLSAFLPIFATASLPNDHYNKLRYSLIPYIYTLYGKAYFDGYTITRPLCMDYKETDITDQYMFGPSLMVCPMYRKGETTREVYLPEGQIWYDFNHPSKIYEGGRTIIVEAPHDMIPVFVPAGAIIAIGQKSEYVGEVRKNDRVDLDIDIYAGQDGYFEIYDDAGEYDYYKTGSYSIVPVTYTESPRTVVIGTRKGEFRGMQKARNVHVAVYDKGKMKAINVYYEGSKIKISL